MKEIKVDGHPDLVRDSKSKAIINTNTTEYENYIKINRVRESERNRINDMESDLKDLKNDIEEIKLLLKSLSSHKT